MIKDAGVRGSDVGFEAAVQHTDLTPVKVESLDIVVANAGA